MLNHSSQLRIVANLVCISRPSYGSSAHHLKVEQEAMQATTLLFSELIEHIADWVADSSTS